ncbi:Pentatricopeptide repeat-containing protein [Forsythia ovata]|uniref:Pentatricopeptide repeat-containing protein n=1 Tax=Forsythia ovata TaxID=205694 RepID=A0ABD1X7D3_9LAMI
MKALAVHNEMAAKGIKTNCVMVSSILQCLCQIGMAPEAVDQFKNFKDLGGLLDEIAYNVVIDALCKMENLNEAVWLLDEMKAKKMVPDIVHYTTLINGKGLQRDLITYNVLVGGFSRSGLAEDAFLLLDDMRGLGLIPGTATHNLIIEGLCLGRKVKEAEMYLYRLEDKSIENYSAMVNGYCESDNATKAYKLFVMLFKEGCYVKKTSRLKLLSSLCLEGEYDRAVTLFEMVLSLDDGPCKKMYDKLIAALCRAGNVKNARWAFDDMVLRGVSPDVITYTILLNGYCRVSFLQEARDLFSDMKERGISPDIITYTVLLDGYSKGNRKKARSQTNARNNKELKRMASAIWCEMEEMGLTADVISYTALIDSHCKSDNLQDAIGLFDEMIDRGLVPDTVTYTALLCGYCKQGNVDKAITLVDNMSAKGIQPDSLTMSTLRQGIVSAKKFQFRH